MGKEKSEALKKKMHEGGKKCKHCGSKRHGANECDSKEKGDEREGKEEKEEEGEK
jgi:hypothetical protein